MTRFNKGRPRVAGKRTSNEAGGPAYKLSPELEFAGIAWTSFAKDEYYRAHDETEKRLKTLLRQVDIVFAANVALIARHTIGLRSISQILTALIVDDNRAKGTDWLRMFVRNMVRRPDDMTETLAFQRMRGLKHGNAQLRAYADKLEGYDEAYLAKWNKGQGLRLYDVANIAHPKSTPALAKLMKGTLPSPRSGETVNWKDADDIAKALRCHELGYQAQLYHLTSFAEVTPDLVPTVCENLVDEGFVAKSGILPYQFLRAYDATLGLRNRDITEALHQASKLSLRNVPRLDNAVVILDHSGSMAGGYGSMVDAYESAGMLAATAALASGADLVQFESTAYRVEYDITNNPLRLYKHLRDSYRWGGTNVSGAIDLLDRPYDYILLFTDEQHWMTRSTGMDAVVRYTQRTGCMPFVFSMNPATYGTTQFHGSRAFSCHGVSDQVFRLAEWFGEHGRDIVRYAAEVVSEMEHLRAA